MVPIWEKFDEASGRETEYWVERAPREDGESGRKETRKMGRIGILVVLMLSGVKLSEAEQWEHPRDRKQEARMMSKERKRWMWSAIALAAASLADSSSSLGKMEGNGLLRSGDGKFGARGVGIKMGALGGMLLSQHLLMEKDPGSARMLTWGNYGMAGVKAGVAIRNTGVEKPSYLMR